MSASRPSRLAFSSDFRYQRVFTRGSLAFSVGAFGFTNFTIPHGLPYKPYFVAFYKYTSGKVFPLFSSTASYAIDGNGGQVDTVYLDSTNLNVTISENNGSAISGVIYYRFYEESVE